MAIYSISQVLLMVDGRRITGGTEDDLCEVEFTSPLFEGVDGVDGFHVQNYNPIKSGKVTIRVSPMSAAATYLSGLVNQDQKVGDGLLTGTGQHTVLIQDQGTGAQYASGKCYFETLPTRAFGPQAGGLEFVLICPEIRNAPILSTATGL